MRAFPRYVYLPYMKKKTLRVGVLVGNEAAAHADPEPLQLIGDVDCWVSVRALIRGQWLKRTGLQWSRFKFTGNPHCYRLWGSFKREYGHCERHESGLYDHSGCLMTYKNISYRQKLQEVCFSPSNNLLTQEQATWHVLHWKRRLSQFENIDNVQVSIHQCRNT